MHLKRLLSMGSAEDQVARVNLCQAFPFVQPSDCLNNLITPKTIQTNQAVLE